MTGTERIHRYAPVIKPQLRLLSSDQLRQIHLASLEVLERTGVDVRLPEAVDLLGNAGADVRDPSRVKIPSHMVDEALRTTPHRITIYGGCSGPLDMSTSVVAYAGPDAFQNYFMVRELSAYYDLPDFNHGGYSESKMLDMQAAAEAALSIFQIGLAGSGLVHDVGYLESGMSCSLEMIMFCDEIIEQVRHFKKMPAVDAQALAVDVIDAVGPGGNFTGHEHTLRHFKKIWYPKYFDRHDYPNWLQDGGRPLESVLREKVQHLLETHQSEPLPAETIRTLNHVLERAAQNAART
jgi:trimethylamine--corrinoid protein Co-methyltransferase